MKSSLSSRQIKSINESVTDEFMSALRFCVTKVARTDAARASSPYYKSRRTLPKANSASMANRSAALGQASHKIQEALTSSQICIPHRSLDVS